MRINLLQFFGKVIDSVLSLKPGNLKSVREQLCSIFKQTTNPDCKVRSRYEDGFRVRSFIIGGGGLKFRKIVTKKL